jgi:hypothetical protein
LTGLGLPLDLVSVYNARTVWVRTNRIAARHGTFRLLLGVINDLETALSLAIFGPRNKPNADTIGIEPPVRR